MGDTESAPREYAEFVLCREMGWTYDDLEAQPAARIEEAFLFLRLEGWYRKWQEQRGTGG